MGTQPVTPELFLVHWQEPVPSLLEHAAELHLVFVETSEGYTFRDAASGETLKWSEIEVHGSRLVLVLCCDDELGASLWPRIRAAGGRIVVTHSLGLHFRDVADVVCDPDELPKVLRSLGADAALLPDLRQQIEMQLGAVYDILRKCTGLDFRHYRQGFAIRRIEQRLNRLQCPDMGAYLGILESDPGEARRLADSFYVRVTQFMRDPGAFRAVRQKLREHLQQSKSLRIWSAGCSTGEEAYSLAMLVHEVAEEVGVSTAQVRILATDSNESALTIARQGEYSSGIQKQLTQERLERFFTPSPNGYLVRPELRQLVQFSQHNLLIDPPFSEIDFILCRNVLIYLSPAIHEKLLCIFHYSLRPGGSLLLGSSETAGESTPLYSLVDERSRLYRRADGPASVGWLSSQMPPRRSVEDHRIDLSEVVQSILQHEFTPRAAVVSEDGHLVWASGELDNYLSMPQGRFRNQIVQMARKGLRNPLRSALLRAREKRRTVRRPGVRVEGRNGRGSILLDITVQPMPELGDGSGLFLVVFQESPEREVITATEENERLQHLEKELVRVSDELERTVQDLEAANEELKSSNEELWAINEEVRAANEELEKSRADIEQKNQELRRANLDLNHLLTSVELPTIFLDLEQRVLRFTPSATEIYHLIDSDLGRPLWQIRDRGLNMPPLPERVERVVSEEIELQDGRHFQRKILPYRDLQGQIIGMVVTFSDVTDLRQSQAQLHASLRELSAFYDQAPVGLGVLDRELQWSKRNHVLGDFALPEVLRQAAEGVLAGSGPVQNLEFSQEKRHFLASLYPLPNEQGETDRISLVVQDVSELKERERDYILQLGLLERVGFAVTVAFLNGTYKFVNQMTRQLTGVGTGSHWREHMFTEDLQRYEQEVVPAVLQNGSWEGEFRWRHRQTGQALRVWMQCVRVDDPYTGKPAKIGTVAQDWTENRRAVEQLEQLRREWEQVFNAVPWGMLMMDSEARLTAANSTVRDMFPVDPIGKTPVDLVPGWENSTSHQMVNKGLAGEPGDIIHQFPSFDRWFHSYYRPIDQGLIIFFEDVSERLRDEERIRDLVSVINNSPDFIAIYDADWNLLSINAAGLAMTGQAQRDGLTLVDFHPQWALEEVRSSVDTILSQGQWQGESELKTASGDSVPVWKVIQPLRTCDGTLRGFSVIAHNISETKHRERLLQESELRFRRAILEAPIPVMILAEDGELLAVSDSLSQATGFTSAEIRHLSHWLLIAHREQADWVREHFNSLLKGEQAPNFEAPVFTRSGQKRLWRFTGSGAGKLDDGRRYAVVMAVDLTDRLENEKALEEGAAFLRRLLDTLSTFVAVCTPDGTLIEVNRASLEAAGLKAEDVLHREYAETYWWAYDASVQAQLREAIHKAAAGKPSRFDVDIRTGTNQFMTIDFQVVPMRDDEGSITHLVPSATDITERKRILRELESGRERFRTLLNSTAEAIYGLDTAGCFTFANRSCLKLLRFDNDEFLLGKNAHWLIHHTKPDGNHYAVEDCPIWQSFHGQKPVYAPREQLYRSDGTSFWAEMWAHPLVIDGEPGGCVVTFWDITERLEQEQELEAAKAAAEAASRAKSDFLANMSHEIRTPMAAILGYVDILLRQANDPDNVECLQIIQRNGAHLLEIINDILDLSKIEAGRLHVEELPVSVLGVMAEVVSLMEVRASEKNLELRVEFHGLLPETISSDPTRLRQILMNLLGNAIKFTETGWVRLSVRFLADAELLEFAVEDTGIGIQPELLPLLFRPFNQGDTSVTRRFGGTGLGLAITGQLVQLLGGSIEVQSTPGQGSLFRFRVATGPIDKTALVEPKGWEHSGLGTATRDPLPTLEGRHVLVADDRRDIRDLVRSYLEEAGARVDTAGDGEATLQYLEKNDVDVLVLDMQMPVLDGYATARQLRQRGQTLPILALTASAMKGDREACVEAGCDGYLTKPVDRLSLIYQVNALAQRRRTLRTLIVEDNPLAGRAVQAMLHSMGCHADLATSAQDALEKAAQAPPDFVLIDLGLPDMDGWELLRRFRAMDGMQNCRYIAHSGRQLSELNPGAEDQPFDAVVQKPATRDALREVLFGRA